MTELPADLDSLLSDFVTDAITLSNGPELRDTIAALKRSILAYGAACAAQEHQKNIETVIGQANEYEKGDLAPEYYRAYYTGYKEALVKAIAALRAAAPTPELVPMDRAIRALQIAGVSSALVARALIEQAAAPPVPPTTPTDR